MLEADWAAAELPSETMKHLREQSAFVREAVAIAVEGGGWLVIL